MTATAATGDGGLGGGLPTKRRFMLFGPEGFREAPRDHRLVIVMGASPEEFFNAIDRSLGTIAKVQREELDGAFSAQLFRQLLELREEALRLEELDRTLADSTGAAP